MEGVVETAFRFLCCWLVVFSFAFSAALTTGPFGLFGRTRTWVKKSTTREWIHDGIGCPVCQSFYIGAVVAVCFATSISEWATMWLTSFGFVCFVTSISPD